MRRDGDDTTTPEPTPTQRAWLELGYGLFLHFGPNTFEGKAWGAGDFLPERFAPARLDCRQWAAAAAEAGMQYAVLTAKHHDGFCLWPSAHTGYSVAASSGAPDVVGRFAEAFRDAGLKVGLYYSLWDRNCPVYQDDAAYAAFLRDQLTELLTNHGPILELWFDGGWDKDHPNRHWAFDAAWEADPNSGLGHGDRWEWAALYEHVHALQPDCLVIQNASSDRPGAVKYHPVDARTLEHFDFVYNEQVCEPTTDPVFTRPDGSQAFLPLECCTSLNPDWFWTGREYFQHPSPATIADWHRRARAMHGNLLLNVGPDRDGLIPEYHRKYLKAARNLID